MTAAGSGVTGAALAVRLRPMRAKDLARHLQWCNDERVNRYLTGFLPPLLPGDVRKWFEVCGHDPTIRLFAIEAGGEHVGTLDLRDISELHRCCEVGYLIGTEHWGRGIGTAAVREACRTAFDELGLERITYWVVEGNDASRRVAEKAGFAYEGRARSQILDRGRRLDQHLYGLVREGAQGRPPGQ